LALVSNLNNLLHKKEVRTLGVFNGLRDGISGASLMAVALVTSFLPYWRRWGATKAEVNRALPGDNIVPHPKGGYTQAITIQAPRQRSWLWVAQTGQDRGGFYSYDFLENLVGCDIHTIDRIVSEYQYNETSAGLKMHPKMPPMPLASIEPGKVLLFGGKIDSDTPVSWLFLLDDIDENTTRLITRWRFAYKPSLGSRIGYATLEPIACVMQRKMLLGLKKRAEDIKLPK
jgi:hypothetical protein